MAKKRGRPPVKAVKGARTRALPGMENARINSLDEIASSIADGRQQRNELATTESALIQRAMKLMHKFKKTVWKHDGIELILVPGDERLRVRLVKGGGNAEVNTGDEAAAEGDEDPEEDGEGDEPPSVGSIEETDR